MTETGIGSIVIIAWVGFSFFWSHRKDSPTRIHLADIETKLDRLLERKDGEDE